MSDRNASSLASGSTGEGGWRAAGSEVRIGPLMVRTDAADVEAFARALGLREICGPVPLTFPIRWLSLPDVRGEISRELGLDQAPLVQQSQTFHFFGPLEPDRDYSFEIVARRLGPSFDRTSLRATVRDVTGNDVLTMDTVLRTLHMAHSAPASEFGRHASAAADGMMMLRVGPFDFAQTQRYAAASLDHNPLHSDIDAAHAVGLDGLIVHGMLVMGQFESALIAWRPNLRVIRLYGTFLRPLPVGGQIAISGRVVKASAERGGEQLILRLVARSDKGDVVCVGEVTAQSVTAGAGAGYPRIA